MIAITIAIILFIIYVYLSLKSDKRRDDECDRIMAMKTWPGKRD